MKDEARKNPTVIENKKDKIAIVGCSDTKMMAPFKDPSFEFWGVNNLFLTLPDIPWSRWFEIHNLVFDGKNFIRREQYEFRGMNVNKYVERLAGLKCPVYMQKKWPQIPNSVVYPVDDITKTFGRYFTNTITYQIAFAIAEGAKTIGIYGVDMAVGTEYHAQRPSCEWIIGFAQGMGVEVLIPDEADLMKNRFLYAFEEQKEKQFSKKIRHIITSMKQRQHNAESQAMHFEKQTQQYVGGIAALHEMEKVWDTCK